MTCERRTQCKVSEQRAGHLVSVAVQSWLEAQERSKARRDLWEDRTAAAAYEQCLRNLRDCIESTRQLIKRRYGETE